MDDGRMVRDLIALLVFPGGLFLMLLGLIYSWVDRKALARLQNRVGPRWFQPLADILKMLAKEEVVPDGVTPFFFVALPMLALAGALTAALYVPMAGLAPSHSFAGDLIVTVYLMSLLTLCLGLAGANTRSRFSLLAATRAFTQLFAYEAPFLLALLGPAIVARSWQISEVVAFAGEHPWIVLLQPLGFMVAILGLMGKLEMPPFDAPEAETELVAGPLTEYSGRGLALFHLAKKVELVVGITLVAAFYLGGLASPLAFLWKTVLLLLVIVALHAVLARLRIDQTVGLWWRYGALLVLGQWLILIVLQVG